MAQQATKPVQVTEHFDESPDTLLTHNDIAVFAFALWEARGCPEGSPEEDWFQAEQELSLKRKPSVKS